MKTAAAIALVMLLGCDGRRAERAPASDAGAITDADTAQHHEKDTAPPAKSWQQSSGGNDSEEPTTSTQPSASGVLDAKVVDIRPYLKKSTVAPPETALDAGTVVSADADAGDSVDAGSDGGLDGFPELKAVADCPLLVAAVLTCCLDLNGHAFECHNDGCECGAIEYPLAAELCETAASDFYLGCAR